MEFFFLWMCMMIQMCYNIKVQEVTHEKKN